MTTELLSMRKLRAGFDPVVRAPEGGPNAVRADTKALGAYSDHDD